MKIGLFTDTYYPQINGVATSVLMLKENLEKLGHRVYVFTTTDPKAKKHERNVFRVASLPFKSSRRVGMVYHPRLARRIKRLGLDLIHTHTEFSLGIFGRSMARYLNIPHIHTYHTIYEDYTHYIVKFGLLDTVAKSAARKLSETFCNSADMVVVPTDKVKDLLYSYNVNKKIVTVPTGISLDKYSKEKYSQEGIIKLRAQIGLRSNDKVILYLGRVSEEKHIHELLENLSSYLKERSNVKLVIVGDGPDRENLQGLSERLNISDRTIFTGERPWDVIGMYYQIGDVFVSASQSETQGLTYIEALASGLPVVAKKDRCLEGVVINGYNGYTYNTKEEFIEYIDNTLFDNVERKRLSNNATESTSKFSAMAFAENIEDQYRYLLDILSKYKRVS
ncbi:glycosyltransferase family 4 protein [Tissierella creatinini]|nr:glycosyltransferase family 4 protein [Tissierella creatinini]TJX66486.1 glycosyltransferase family 4 protein [Soehngenia saccharolytica]